MLTCSSLKNTTMALTDLGIEDVRKKAFKICQEFLGGPWEEITISQFIFSTISGGLSNSIYHCALPESVILKDSKIPRDVLLRIYGPLQDDRNVVITEAATFTLLAERKLGPKLFGVFSNGRLEEFIPSRTLKTKDYRVMYPAIAREMAKIHALDVPVRKVPDFFPEGMKRWLEDVEKEVAQRSNDPFELEAMYREEMAWLTEEMKKTKSPVVYCHNDLQGGNILFRQDSPSEDDPRLMLIDFEFGAYNYRGFDLANQFCEWCFDYHTGDNPYYTANPDKFPSKQEQTLFARAYLKQLVEEGVISPTAVEDEIKNILENNDVFSMAALFYWSLWSVKMSYLSADFPHWEHGETRRKMYMEMKKKYLGRTLCNGDSELTDRNQ